ncbi:fumarate reductase subunit FrdD [Chromobacterium sphagni]|uniref:Fumarate reductase n=1 Tax=Chromobacterium sphagni TaxID=1903179 RepID=A0A1S1X249_9NEIS|nr:fumarate reductase subunit FrdD [Chromobacterium sphagni]OHX13256.1 fumarate reductase [Chromobacterium sphagni]OHX16966.1 fumarate reductase [Chromobacterium sphagni]
MKRQLKRSHAPIFWVLFGAGGMLAALLGPALVFITGLALPLGLLPQRVLGFAAMRALAQSLMGKGALWLLISLLLWHAAHRVYHSLHDLGIRGGALAKALTYGLAMLATLLSAALLLGIGR